MQSTVDGLEFRKRRCIKRLIRTNRKIQKLLQSLNLPDPTSFLTSLLASLLASLLMELLSECHGEIFNFQRLNCSHPTREGGFVNFGLRKDIT